MYTRPILYKVYSIIILVSAALSFLGSIFQAVFIFEVPPFMPSFINDILTVLKIVLIITTAISMFFSYTEFSSMYSFADMINYENNNTILPYERKAFVFGPKFYKNFGLAIFSIVFTIQAISCAVIIIAESVRTQSFVSLPLIPLAVNILTIFFVYVTYYAKYKAFGDLLEIISVKEPDEIMKNSLKENKPNLLRGYCVFLFILAILSAVGIAVLLFLTVSPVAAIFGIAGAVVYTVAIIISGFITFLCLAIMGCFFDNLAKMLEHYMIKYHLMNE